MNTELALGSGLRFYSIVAGPSESYVGWEQGQAGERHSWPLAATTPASEQGWEEEPDWTTRSHFPLLFH